MGLFGKIGEHSRSVTAQLKRLYVLNLTVDSGRSFEPEGVDAVSCLSEVRNIDRTPWLNAWNEFIPVQALLGATDLQICLLTRLDKQQCEQVLTVWTRAADVELCPKQPSFFQNWAGVHD